MPLKRRVARLEDVDETERRFYVKKGDEYVPDLDGEDETATLQRTLDHEKRQRAEAVKKVAAYEERYKDIDPDKVKENQERLNALEDERLKTEGKYAELAERKYVKATEAHEAEKAALAMQLEKEKTERAQIERDHSTLILRQEMETTLLGMGANPLGLSYAVSLHLPKWSLDKEKKMPVRYDAEGHPLPGLDPNKPLSMKEDLTDWQKKDPFAEKFFLPSSGGGARGGIGGLNGGAVVLSREDARDHGKFMAAHAQALKAGVPLDVPNK